MKTGLLLSTVSLLAMRRAAFAVLAVTAMATLTAGEARADWWSDIGNAVGGALNGVKDAVVGAVVTVEKDTGLIKDTAPAQQAPPAQQAAKAPPAQTAPPPAASLISNDGGGLVSTAGGTLVSTAGGTLVGNASGTLVGNASGTATGNFVGNNGSAALPKAGIISDNSAGAISAIGSGVISHDSGYLISNDGGGVVSNDGAGITIKGAAYKAVAPTADQVNLAAAQAAKDVVLSASDLVKRDTIALQNAKNGNDLNLVKQFETKLDNDKTTLNNSIVSMAGKVNLVTDVTAAQALIASTYLGVQNDNDDAKNQVAKSIAAASAPAALTADQTAALTKAQAAAASAQTTAAAADAAYKAATNGGTVIRPADFDTRVAVDIQGAAKAVADAQAKYNTDQALLVAANNGDPGGKVAAALGKPGAKLSSADLANLRDTVAADSRQSFLQQDMASAGYAEKLARSDFANTDLAAAKTAKDTLTALATKTTDLVQLAALNSAISTASVVQQAAQAKADQLSADTSIARLQAQIRDTNMSDADKTKNQAEVTRLQGVSAASASTLATIVKSNPTLAPVSAIASNTYVAPTAANPAGSSKTTITPIASTLNAVVLPVIQQVSQLATSAVQSNNALVQQVTTALQQAKIAVPVGTADALAALGTLKQTYSIQSVSGAATATTQVASNSPVVPLATTPAAPVVDKSELTPAVTQMLLQSAPGAIQAMQAAQQAALAKGDQATADGLGKNITNLQAQLAAAKTMPTPAVVAAPAAASASPAATTATPVATAPAAVAAPVAAPVPTLAAAPAPVVDKSELTPAVVQMLLQSGPAAIQAMQSAQQAALAKGDQALADGLGKDLTNLQAQVAAAKAMPAPAAVAATTPATTPVTAPVVVATATPTASALDGKATAAASPASSTPVAVANASPSATAAATPAASASGTSKAGEVAAAPTKITEDQGKAVHQALRTIPGDLSKTEQKTFSTLSDLVDRATTKGLTPEEAVTLKAGLAALADKHPKAEKQHGLTTIANSVATVQKPVGTEKAPVGGASGVTPSANAAPDGKAAPAGTSVARTDAPREGNQEKDRPMRDQAIRNGERPATAAVTPANSSTTITAPAVTAAKPSDPDSPAVVPHPDVKPTVASTVPAAKMEPQKIQQVPTPTMHSEPPKAPMQTMHEPPKFQQASPPKAPQAPVVASSAPKPPAPAPKAPSCSPNMVNGKMMGMICH